MCLVKNSSLLEAFDLKKQQWNPHLLPQVAPMEQLSADARYMNALKNGKFLKLSTVSGKSESLEKNFLNALNN
jgi:hypothetical protein